MFVSNNQAVKINNQKKTTINILHTRREINYKVKYNN